MSRGNNSKAKAASPYKNPVTGKTYTKMQVKGNDKALKAADAYATVNPKKTFYA